MRDHLYLHLFDEERCGVHLHGLCFAPFWQVTSELLAGRSLLLLQHAYEMASFHPGVRLGVVPPEGIPPLLQEDIFAWGAFSWIDVASAEALSSLPPQDLAEILYLGHTTEPLAAPHFPSLDNHFLYLSFQDGLFLRLYLSQKERLGALLAGALHSFAGEGAPPPGADLQQWLLNEAPYGLWLNIAELKRWSMNPTQPVTVPYDRIGPWNSLESLSPPHPPQPQAHLLLTPDGWQQQT